GVRRACSTARWRSPRMAGATCRRRRERARRLVATMGRGQAPGAIRRRCPRATLRRPLLVGAIIVCTATRPDGTTMASDRYVFFINHVFTIGSIYCMLSYVYDCVCFFL